MAASEPYDFLSTITPDYDYTLTIKAQAPITEEGWKNQVIHMADDNTEERITLSTGSIYYVSWDWHLLDESESGTVFDMYHDPVKANGIGRSFRWSGYDGHTYVVRFDMRLARTGRQVSIWGLPAIRLRILGRIAD